jgi:sulfate permease, SulP family
VAPRIPGSLVAVLFGIAAVSVLDLADEGVAIVGAIESGLPSLGLPDGVEGSDYFTLLTSAIGVALVGFAEGLGAAKTYATKEHYPIDANRELIGLSASNIGAGLSSGMVVNGSLSKTAVNGRAGAKSQLSGLVCAALTVVTLLFLTSLFEDLPEATLAAVVIAVVIELIDWRALVRLYRTSTSRLGRIYGIASRPDFIAAMAALLGVLIFDTLPGLVIGVVVSILLLIYRTSRPNVAFLGTVPGGDQFVDLERGPMAHPVSGIVIARPEAALFFASSEHVRAAVMDKVDATTRAVIIDAETVPMIDVTAASAIIEMYEDLQGRGIQLVVARDIGQLRDLLRVDAAQRSVELPPLYPTVRAAVEALQSGDR